MLKLDKVIQFQVILLQISLRDVPLCLLLAAKVLFRVPRLHGLGIGRGMKIVYKL